MNNSPEMVSEILRENGLNEKAISEEAKVKARTLLAQMRKIGIAEYIAEYEREREEEHKRKEKIDIASFTAVIFTSRHAIDHFFRICEEMKVNISQDTKYFCIIEALALYLQKFILYRERKVFYGADGTNKSMFDVINKHKENEKFLYVCSENQQDNEIVNWLKNAHCEYQLAFIKKNQFGGYNIEYNIPASSNIKKVS
jgi:uroporphyrinogen-III synthase